MGKARRKIIKRKNIRTYEVNLEKEKKLDLREKLNEMVDDALRSGLEITYLKKSRRKNFQ